MDRRKFIKFSALGAVSPLLGAGVISNLNAAKRESEKMMSIIDLTLCDGCAGRETPACVSACRTKNAGVFPEPQKPIMDYWPQTKHEDYSDKRDVIDRLTPYNFTYVEKVEVAGRKVSVPRRCMHCDNPPCQKLCAFGVISKSAQGAVEIDRNFCLGGAKCRAVCPWGIPQRQGGVGIYLKIAPKLAGGGVMYKCDMCADLLAEGKKPTCESACPKGAIKFGKRAEILAEVERARAAGRHIYGLDENGGTATVYISDVAFEDIDRAITAKHANKARVGVPHLKRVKNPLEDTQVMAEAALVAPIAGVIGAGIAAWKSAKAAKNIKFEKEISNLNNSNLKEGAGADNSNLKLESEAK